MVPSPHSLRRSTCRLVSALLAVSQLLAIAIGLPTDNFLGEKGNVAPTIERNKEIEDAVALASGGRYHFSSASEEDQYFAIHPWYDRWGLQQSRAAATWTYSEPSKWVNGYPACGGNQQSPVNIEPRSSQLKAFPKFDFTNYGNIDRMILTNNGHTAVYSLPTGFNVNNIPYITGGGLTDKYQFVQFHLHWGKNSQVGSEHTLQSKSYPAELHLVHYNTKYSSFTEATDKADGLAVLGIFIKIGNSDSSVFKALTDQLGEVRDEESRTNLNSLVSFKDLLPAQTTTFYRYSGSLTTPGCQQIVTWTVFDKPISISEGQLAKFRTLKNDQKADMVENARPPQPLNGRTITYRAINGCEIPRSWPFTSTPLRDLLTYNNCVFKYGLGSVLSSFGLG